MRDLTVLILEDDPACRDDLVATLQALGVRHITKTCDGHAGLAALRANAAGFDIVISDLEMNGMDGLEFIRHAVSHRVGGLILCSGLGDAVLSSAEWMARAYNAPLLGVLPKRPTAVALSTLINKLHGNHTVFSDILGDPSAGAAPDDQALDDIRFALDTSQFVPFYQPKISLETGELVGAEILARWEHPQLGVLTPVQFVDLMEMGGLIESLTYTLLEQSCRHAARWRDDGLVVPLAINVSPLTLEQPRSASQLLARIAKAGLPVSQFTVEITERAFTRDVKGMLENVLRLRMHGCGISVDDFGTGYSSLQQLNRVPVTELKLDRSFVRRMASNAKAASIVESMIDLARRLNLKTVAEGIDTADQQRLLGDLGCHVGQGFLIARPMTEETFVDWCREREAAIA